MTDRQDDLTSAALRARIAAASGSPGLRGSAVPGRVGLRGDHDFDPLLRPEGPLVAAAVLVPVFDDPNDARALGVLSEAFPGRRVTGIRATDLVWGLGAFHCLSQQQPR